MKVAAKIAVMGAGAVGCYYGGLLARAGHEVTLIGRALHVDALQRRGLRLQTAAFDEQVPLQASTDAAAVRGADLVLFCVKSTDTADAGAAMAPHLAPGALVLSLQNGVDNLQRLRALLPNPVAAAVVYVATGMGGPGHVQHHGRGELVLEDSPATRAVAPLLQDAGIAASLSDNVIGALWAKLVLNCAWNALSAITQLPYGRMLHGDGVQAVMRDLVGECLAVAAREGVHIPGDPWAAVLEIGRTMPGQLSSTAQDLARHRRTEIAHINGHVVARGAALGVATPMNHALLTLVRLLEARAADADQ
jgi:2-dehydropantoate 2-reductase